MINDSHAFSTPEPTQAPTDTNPGLRLTIHPGTYAICRMHSEARIPRWVHRSSFYSVSRSPDELSILSLQEHIPSGVKCEPDWRCIQVLGTLDLSLIGVLDSMAHPLAEANVELLTVSTFDTDYLFVRQTKLERAVQTLERVGHHFELEPAISEVEVEADARGDEEMDAEEMNAKERGPEDRDEASEAEPAAPAVPSAKEIAKRAAAKRAAAKKKAAQSKAAEPRDQPESYDRPNDSDEDRSYGDDETRPQRTTPRDENVDVDVDVDDQDHSAAAQTANRPAEERQPSDGDGDEGTAFGHFTGAIPQDPVETTEDSFESLGVSPEIIVTLEEIGFHHPTPIQAGVLPMALEGSDILGLAETGSGKTGAFGLPMAQRLTHGEGVRGLILCPTREIALQTKAFLDVFGRNHSLETAVVIGGVKFGPQIDALRRQPDIIVATPGRLADHMRRRNVSLRNLEELVLDEADHMLDLGFLPQIQEIVDQVPRERRTMMFSATMPPLIERLTQRFLDDPYIVDLRPVNRVAAGIAHRLYLVKSGQEKTCLIRLLEEEQGSTLVFARRKLDTEWLARQLSLTDLPVDRIHSDRSQAQRVRALRGFREGKTRILVATDVAARGIDVPRLSHVINFGLPDSVEDYIHRAGRTARGKAVGTVSTIGTWQDKVAIRDVERLLGHKIERHELEGVEIYREAKRRPTVRRRRML